MQEGINKLDNGVLDTAKQTVLDALEASDVDPNKSYIKVALRTALNGLLVFVLNDLPGTKESLDDKTVRVETAPKSLAIFASAVARDIAAMDATVWYASMIVKEGVEESIKSLVHTSPSPPLSGPDSSFDEAWENRKDRRSKRKLWRRKASVFLSDNGT